jgi:hypothetical protein
MDLQEEFERVVARIKADVSIEQTAREVQAKYGPMFTPAGVASLNSEKFKEFLRYEGNKHWSRLNLFSGRLTADLSLLRQALGILVDERKRISDRIDEARATVDGLGKARFSAILLVAFPAKYGVYNSISDKALEKIGMHPRESVPNFDSLSAGAQYERVNQVLKELSEKYDISYWSLDTVLGVLGHQESLGGTETGNGAAVAVGEVVDEAVAISRFGMEKHLEEFRVENWAQTPLSVELELLVDDDGEVVGEQYMTGVGPIDLLCRNKDGTGYTVVELKLGQSSDATIGQVTRYMGWIKKNLAKDGQSVRGLIICKDTDEKITAALSVVPNIEVYTYTVSFTLERKNGSGAT